MLYEFYTKLSSADRDYFFYIYRVMDSSEFIDL